MPSASSTTSPPDASELHPIARTIAVVGAGGPCV